MVLSKLKMKNRSTTPYGDNIQISITSSPNYLPHHTTHTYTQYSPINSQSQYWEKLQDDGMLLIVVSLSYRVIGT